ncbi:cytochrome P450 [Lentinula edodes]|nr:cytochrome P450 [Lentinula edodes]
MNSFHSVDAGKYLATAFILLTFRLLYSLKNNRHLPPGPRGLPILGNILQFASASQIWLVFDKWKFQYGPIMYLNLAGQHIIVLNTKAAAIELLERRSAIYSDRPKSIVGKYIGAKLAMPFIGYGKRWQRMRRAAHAVLNARASARYQPVQIEEAVIFAHKLMCDTSSPLFAKIARSASSMISVIYGKQLLASSKGSEQSLDSDALQNHSSETHGLPPSDPLEALINAVHISTNALYPGTHLVESLPILDYLPAAMAKWKRKAKHDFQQISNVYKSYYNIAVISNQQQPSLCVSLAENEVTGELSEVEKAWITGTISAASLDTTTVTLSYFLYAMSLHPSVQERAHHELDEVVGRSRIPTFDDMMELSYIRAIVKEASSALNNIQMLTRSPRLGFEMGARHAVGLTARCNGGAISPVHENPVTHTLIDNFRFFYFHFKDDWYKGYFIPKGTIIFPNVWSMNREEETYGRDADQFSPERFLQKSGKGNRFIFRPEFESGDGHCTYGFGRRICVGKYVAENSLFITMCTILWALHIEPKAITTSSKGKRGPVKDVLNLMPDFDCQFSPRFPEAESILQHLQDNVLDTENNLAAS